MGEFRFVTVLILMKIAWRLERRWVNGSQRLGYSIQLITKIKNREARLVAMRTTREAPELHCFLISRILPH